ncbi:MAG: LysR family transcriptional regulator [Hydrogenophaga sp.]|uniref:LysR family transcriptional regulator n=1 Tax=Hydrogenophaga sp. TaxID=1904254 RepID=UPI001DC6D2AE|nr:LysR family transcriptional regulator [Hydrogenophaga sp.]MBX3609631.1 LysR family transcriptional regulator [Hydrogenophaga sp.]
MPTLADLQFLVRAGRAASLSEAARATGMSPAAGSALVKRLEAELGLRLFVRSTRSLRLTPEGQAFVQQCEQGLEIIGRAHESLLAGRDVIRGVLRLALPSDLGRNLVLPWLQAFRGQHPQVELRLQLSDRVAGVYREQVDVALRYGEPGDSSLIALPVAPHNRRVLCASPAYLRQHGTPRHPNDLADHHCLCFQLSDRVHDRWRFTRGRTELVVTVKGGWQCDDGDAVRRLAVMGEGIAYKSRIDVAPDLASGALVPLCEDWQGELAPLYLACPDRSQLRPAVRLLRDLLVQRVAGLTGSAQS